MTESLVTIGTTAGQLTFSDGCTLVLVAIAAITDVAQGKVYNKLTYPAIVAGLVSNQFAIPGSVGLYGSLAGLAAGWLLYIVLHKYCGIGMGDVKLMAAVGAFKGLVFVMFSTFYVLCAGSVLGIVVLACRGRLLPALRWVAMVMGNAVRRGVDREPLENGGTLMPFGPAILLGVGYSIFLEAARGRFTLGW